MSTPDANAEFLRIMRNMLKSQNIGELFEELTTTTYNQVIARQDAGLPAGFPFTDADQTALTFSTAVRLFKLLARIPSTETACVVMHNMCIANNVPMILYEHDIEELDNLAMLGDQDLLADNNRNIELTLGRQQRDKVAR